MPLAGYRFQSKARLRPCRRWSLCLPARPAAPASDWFLAPAAASWGLARRVEAAWGRSADWHPRLQGAHCCSRIFFFLTWNFQMTRKRFLLDLREPLTSISNADGVSSRVALGAPVGCAVFAELEHRPPSAPAGCAPGPAGTWPAACPFRPLPKVRGPRRGFCCWPRPPPSPPGLLSRASSLAGELLVISPGALPVAFPGPSFQIWWSAPTPTGVSPWRCCLCIFIFSGSRSPTYHCRLIYRYACKVCFIWVISNLEFVESSARSRSKTKGGPATSPHPFIFYLVTTDFCCFRESSLAMADPPLRRNHWIQY